MNEREIVRGLAKQYAEAAFSEETRARTANWARLNALDAAARPPIIVDQLPWHEFRHLDELQLRCADPLLREMERYFRVELFRTRRFGADLILPPFYPLTKSYTDTGCGLRAQRQDESEHAAAQTHLYVDQLPDEASLTKLHKRVITAKPEETARRKAAMEDVIGDLLEVRPTGVVPMMFLWDRIVEWKGAEACLYGLVDEPELLHEIIRRCAEIEMDAVDQLEAQNLLAAGPGIKCHCVETYVDEDRFRAVDLSRVRAADCWAAGAAQIFSGVSPAMHDEVEIEYVKPIYDRFGWVNYGCCEPLSRKIGIIRRMKTVRSISASPWTNVAEQAEAMGGDFVMLRKPNPAYVRAGYPEIDAVRRETRETLRACRASGTPVAFVLKDVTTAAGRPEAIGEWVRLVESEIENY